MTIALRRLPRRLGGIVYRSTFKPMQVSGNWRFNGADLAAPVQLEELGLEHEERQPYGASPWLTTARALNRLNLSESDVIADLGAGKGMGVLLAAEHPVRRVVGVELAPELAEIGRANIERNRSRLRAREVEMVTEDVLEWEIPDDLSVVYLFSPILGSLFDTMMQQIIASHDRSPRPMRVVYHHPREHDRVLATGRFLPLDVRPSFFPARPRWWRHGDVIVTYGLVGHEYPVPRRRPPNPTAISFWSETHDDQRS